VTDSILAAGDPRDSGYSKVGGMVLVEEAVPASLKGTECSTEHALADIPVPERDLVIRVSRFDRVVVI